jgi:hypothetical protein
MALLAKQIAEYIRLQSKFVEFSAIILFAHLIPDAAHLN